MRVDDLDEAKQVELYKMAMQENMITVIATALCVGLFAIGSNGSLHSLWGLLILVNLNTFKTRKTTK